MKRVCYSFVATPDLFFNFFWLVIPNIVALLLEEATGQTGFGTIPVPGQYG